MHAGALRVGSRSQLKVYHFQGISQTWNLVLTSLYLQRLTIDQNQTYHIRLGAKAEVDMRVEGWGMTRARFGMTRNFLLHFDFSSSPLLTNIRQKMFRWCHVLSYWCNLQCQNQAPA